MKIGITFDLRAEYLSEGFDEEETAEFDREETIAGIETALHNLGFLTDRIGNAKNLVVLLASGRRWDLVFNICEGMYGIGREAQVPAILDIYRIPYTFSDPMVLALALHKGMTKRVVRDMGIPTPEFAVLEEVEDMGPKGLCFPLFVKPLAEGSGKGIGEYSKIDSSQELRSACVRLLEKYRRPVLVEEYLPGRELTAGVVGTGRDSQVIGVMEIFLREDGETHAYSYSNKQDYERFVEYRLVDGETGRACEEAALKVWQGLGCRDAGRIDFRMDRRGIINFMEINPLAGLDEAHSDLPILSRMRGISYERLIQMIMESALRRL